MMLCRALPRQADAELNILHPIDRVEAEAALRSAPGPKMVLRYLLRPKNDAHVVTVYLPWKDHFHHDIVTKSASGRFLCILGLGFAPPPPPPCPRVRYTLC